MDLLLRGQLGDTFDGFVDFLRLGLLFGVLTTHRLKYVVDMQVELEVSELFEGLRMVLGSNSDVDIKIWGYRNVLMLLKVNGERQPLQPRAKRMDPELIYLLHVQFKVMR